MTDVSAVSAKRKRGRPRKDGSIQKKSPENHKFKEAHINNNVTDRTVIGRVVHGVVEGSFDAGYFISVTIGNDKTPFRGIVFQPGKFIPITAGNDVAPKMKMYHRSDVSRQVLDDHGQINSGSSRLETMREESFTPITVGSHNVLSNNNSSYMVSENTGTTDVFQQIFTDDNTHRSTFDFQKTEVAWKSPHVEFHHELFNDQFRAESKDLGPDIHVAGDFLDSQPEKGNLKLYLNNTILGRQHELRNDKVDACIETDHLEQRHYDFVQEDPLLQHSYLISEPMEFILQKP